MIISINGQCLGNKTFLDSFEILKSYLANGEQIKFVIENPLIKSNKDVDSDPEDPDYKSDESTDAKSDSSSSNNSSKSGISVKGVLLLARKIKKNTTYLCNWSIIYSWAIKDFFL